MSKTQAALAGAGKMVTIVGWMRPVTSVLPLLMLGRVTREPGPNMKPDLAGHRGLPFNHRALLHGVRNTLPVNGSSTSVELGKACTST